MEKVNKFNILHSCRYHITTVCNVSPQGHYNYYTIGAASSPWELVMNITYAQLCDSLKQHFCGDGADGNSMQRYRNHVSTLNSFLASFGKTVESRIGVELGSGFNAALKHYLTMIQVAKRTLRDRRSHLHLVRRIYTDLEAKRQSPERTPGNFETELRAAVAQMNLAPKTLAKQAGISPSALSRWLRGATPNTRGMPSLRRLESALALPRDHLVRLVGVGCCRFRRHTFKLLKLPRTVPD